jgi:hypothetical protein
MVGRQKPPLQSTSPGSDEIATELIQAEGEKLPPEILKIINSIWNKWDE